MPWAGEGSDGGDFDQHYDRLLNRAYYVGWRFFHNQSLAQEVAQEALTRAYARWSRVRSHDNPEAWVARTAINVSLEFRRKAPTLLSSADDAFRPHATPASDDQVAVTQLLAAAMKKLSKRQRDVVAWRYLFDASVDDTARELHMSVSQVKDATHEAIKKLRRTLGDQGPWL